MNEYKLKFGNRVLTYPGHNGYVMFNGTQPKSLTLYASEGGTLTANEITGLPGDTINLSTAYNTYWRFSGYEITGDGELVGDTYTFGSEDATICACYKKNSFTAIGGFESGSNVDANAAGAGNSDYKSVSLPIVLESSTGEIPASWYSNSNEWNPSNASSYSINVNAAASFWMKKYGYISACILHNDNNYNTVITSCNNGNVYYYYNENYNTTSQNNIILSAYLRGQGYDGGYGGMEHYRGYSRYLSSGTTGSWTATGYAP